MAGSAKFISIAGERFDIPADTDISVVLGGKLNSEGETYGSGRRIVKKKQTSGGLKGVIVYTGGDVEDRLNELAAMTDITITYSADDAVYSFTGALEVGDEGVKTSSYNNKSEAFDIMCTIGTIKKSESFQ